MFKKIAIGLALVVLLFVAFVALQPGDFRIARSTTTSAPAAAVFAQVNDFRKWSVWNPFAKLDPSMKQTYEGAPAGTGAVYAWSGNSQAGEGRMTIVESRPNDLVRIQLDFFKPFAATNQAAFTFQPQGDRTAVTWSMTGTNNFVAKVFALFVDFDKTIGGEFEKGLAAMKSAAEASVH